MVWIMFGEPCDSPVCMDHEGVVTDFPLILSVFLKSPQGFSGASPD